MKDSFLKKFTILFSGSFISIIIGLLTTPIITRLVDPVQYGQLSFFNMYSNLILLVATVGLDQSFVKYFYEYEEKGRRGLLYRCTAISLIVASVILVVAYIFVNNKNIVIYLFIVHVIALILNRFSMLLIRMQQKTKWYSVLNVISKVLYVGIILSFILGTSIDRFIILILGTTISNIIVTVISIWLEKNWWDVRKKTYSIEKISSKKLLLYGYPYIFTFAITWVFQSIDKISIKKISSYEEVGIYAGAMSLVSLFAIIQTTFNTMWVPIAFEHYNKNPEEKEFYSKVNASMTVIMFFIALSMILCKDLFVLLLGEKYRQASYIMPFLIFNPLMYTLSETTVHGINFMNKTKMHIYIALGACITNIIGNALMVPLYGAKGAAISTGLAYVVFFSLRTFISNKYYKVEYNLKKFYIVTILTIIFAGVNTFLNTGIIILGLYIVIVSVICVLYWRIILEGAKYAKEIINKWIKTSGN